MNMRKFCLNLLPVLLCFYAAVSRAGWSDGEPLLIGMEADHYPFSYVDTAAGTRAGFNLEFAQKMCGVMERRCIITFSGYRLLRQMLEDGRLDMVVSSFTRPAAGADYAYSDGYYESHPIFITAHNRLNQVSKAALAGKSVGVKADSAEASVIATIDTAGTLSSLKVFDNYSDLFRALNNFELDFAYVESITGFENMKRMHRRFRAITVSDLAAPESHECRAVVIKQNSPQLESVNAAIRALRTDGTAQFLSLRYFPFMSY